MSATLECRVSAERVADIARSTDRDALQADSNARKRKKKTMYTDLLFINIML
jgi:hypothetical protein